MFKSFVVTIIGAGGSGILAVSKLAEKFLSSPLAKTFGLKFNMIDRRPIAGGNTYNRINVDPKMTTPLREIGLNHREHFVQTINQNVEYWKSIDSNLSFTQAGQVDPNSYTTYHTYGYYLRNSLSTIVEAKNPRLSVSLFNQEAVDTWELPSGAVVKLDSGQTLSSDKVIISVGNFEPRVLHDSLTQNPMYYNNSDNAYHPSSINESNNIGIIGMSQAAHSSVIAGFLAGYTGKYLMASANGIKPFVERDVCRPYVRKIFTIEALNEIVLKKGALDAKTLAKTFTKEILLARRQGVDFRDVVDSVIHDSNTIWKMLPMHEKQIFYSDYYPLWSALRYRLPIEFHKVTESLISEGRLVQKSGLMEVIPSGKEFLLRFKNTSNPNGEPTTISVDKLINCTGPIADVTKIKSTFLQAMIERKTLHPHPLGGIAVSDDLKLINPGGAVSKPYYTLGPTVKGSLIEHVNMNAIRSHAEIISNSILDDMKESLVRPRNNF